MSETVARPQPRTPSARIVAELLRRIEEGELRPGDRVPSTRQITQEWDVAMATATKVLTTLRQAGLVRAVPGVGTVVAEGAPAPAARTVAPRRVREGDQELTRERIIAAAIDVADGEGLAGLSMRRLAGELGVAAMSLYRHVPGKEDLLTLMMDEALRYDPLPALPPGWRAGLESVARLQWDAYRKHPWLAQVMSFTRPVATPHAARHTERAMSAVDGLGLSLPEVVRIAVVLAAFVRGLAVNFEAEAEAELESGLTADQWMETHGDMALSAVTRTDEFPIFQRLGGGPEIDLSLDTLFEFGLQRLLDGVGAFIAERTAAGGQ